MNKCAYCDKEAVFEGLCSEHWAEFEAWKEQQLYRYGDKPNEWALLTSFRLSKARTFETKDIKERVNL